AHRVSTELLQSAPRQCERDHRLGSDSGRRDHAYIRPFVRGFHRLAGCEIDRAERPSQSRDRLQIPADANILAIRNSAFDAARIISRAAEPGELFALISYFIMNR